MALPLLNNDNVRIKKGGAMSGSYTIFISIFLFFLIIVAIYLNIKRNQALNLSRESREALRRITTELEPLRKYQVIADAHAESQKIKKEARKYSHDLTARADMANRKFEEYSRNLKLRTQLELKKLKAESTAQITAETKEAQATAKDILEKAQISLDNAIAESRRILNSAKKRAEEIAGNALKAKDKSEHFEKTAKAMKNVIEGYGDEYLIPNMSVLDELAEDWGHKEAGIELKKARVQTKGMIKNGIAADCDYVESYRRSTAIHFVLDAFNGKVDTVLSKVRHNNFGKLEREIKDAFNLVNGHGRAFRNACILPDFLEARLAELKWAVAVNELKLQEREEQRRIKAAIREEQKAVREFERARKKAEKEERMLQKAMAKVRKQLEAASQEKKAEFEQQIAVLQHQLEEAEAKNQRALSMAQQTRQGHVYVLSNIGSFGEGVFKIGLTRRLEPMDRVKELGDASVPFGFDVHAMIHSEDAPTLENELHKTFQANRVNQVNFRKEYFRVNIAQIRQNMEALGIEGHWTMKAEAREYRETLAIETANKNKEPVAA